MATRGIPVWDIDPDSKVHGANMGSTWALSAPDGPHVGHMNLVIWGYIKNNARATVNNDFWSRVGWFANDFHEWRSHEWKSWANYLTSDQKIVIHGKECFILFLTRYFIYWTHRSATDNHRSLISPLSLGTAFSDLTLWRHHSWSVTSCERDALALWRQISRLFCKGDLH